MSLLVTVLFYNDFFKAPKHTKQPSKPTTVRFRDEVRVKKIKAKGKNLPVSSMYEDDDDEGEEEEGEEEEGEEAWAGVQAGDSEDEDVEMEEDEDAEGEDDSDGSDDFATSQRDAMSRVKDDLFADEEDDEEEEKGTFAFSFLSQRRLFSFLPTKQIFPHTKDACPRSKNK